MIREGRARGGRVTRVRIRESCAGVRVAIADLGEWGYGDGA
jgi:hypothetical protein